MSQSQVKVELKLSYNAKKLNKKWLSAESQCKKLKQPKQSTKHWLSKPAFFWCPPLWLDRSRLYVVEKCIVVLVAWSNGGGNRSVVGSLFVCYYSYLITIKLNDYFIKMRLFDKFFTTSPNLNFHFLIGRD